MACFKAMRLADSEPTTVATRSVGVSMDAEFNSPSFDAKNGMVGLLLDASTRYEIITAIFGGGKKRGDLKKGRSKIFLKKSRVPALP